MKQAIDPALEHEIVNKATDLLSILSKKDALSIFLLAKDGLKAETDTPQKIGLTRKQYYTRLKQLVDAGLIDKSGDTYLHTTLGSFVHQKHILELLEHIRNVKQMKMIDTLKRTSQFSEEDIAGFLNKLTGSSITANALTPCRVVSKYEDLVSTTVERMELCKYEILLATRYANDLIINALVRKANAGVSVRLLADIGVVRNHLIAAREKLQVTDKNSAERLDVAGNPFYPQLENVGRKFFNVPYSLVIFDGKEVGVELVDRFETEKFESGILIRDETVCNEMKRVFNTWWNSAQEDDLTKLLQNMTIKQPEL